MEKTEMIEKIEKIKICCFLLGMVFILIWFLMYVFAGDWIYSVHSRWFDLTKQQFAMLHYAGMMAAKIWIFLFFLLPWLASKLCIRL